MYRNADLMCPLLPNFSNVIFPTTNHSILFSDPGNESQRSCGSKTPSESRIAQLVAEILHDTFRWMLSKRGSAWAFCSPGDKKDTPFLYINKCTFYMNGVIPRLNSTYNHGNMRAIRTLVSPYVRHTHA